MSTWKSKEVTVDIDMEIDYRPVKYRWEYQTTVDVLSIHSDGAYPGYGTPDRPFNNKDFFNPSTAFITLQAIANWIELYHSKEKLEELLKNNPFSSGEANK